MRTRQPWSYLPILIVFLFISAIAACGDDDSDTPDAPLQCTYDGVTYEIGETVPSEDCNTCTCSEPEADDTEGACWKVTGELSGVVPSVFNLVASASRVGTRRTVPSHPCLFLARKQLRDDVEDVDSDPEGAIELGAALPAPADSDDEAAPAPSSRGPLSWFRRR